MTRLQILELPEGTDDERPPFVLVVDEYTAQRVVTGAGQTITSFTDPIEHAAATIGARGTLVFAETVEIPANDVSAELREGLQQNVGEVYETARRSLSESETFGHQMLQRAENAEGRARAMEVQRDRANRRAERAEAGRVAADNVLRAVCDVSGGPHVDPVVKARETLALAEARQKELVDRMDQVTDALGLDRMRDWDEIVTALRAYRTAAEQLGRRGASGKQALQRAVSDVRLMGYVTDAAGFDRMDTWPQILAALREIRGTSAEGHPQPPDEEGGQ
ncbi:hypothetical protein [Streptomyces parvus]|uniref:hypothetical protein n=1 Tax=Streptomyces parvus TaxID=66428 RepID=UPI0033CA949D